MGQTKRRFYILGLSLLVLVIALAGLLAVLETLPKSGSITANPPSPSSSQPSATPSAPVNLTPDIALNPVPKISLPDSFKLDLSKATDPTLALSGANPPHLPLMSVTGAENTQYLKSLTASVFDGTEWLQDDLSGFVPYDGQTLTLPHLNPDQIITDNITVAMLTDIINGKVALPTSLYPVSVNASTPLLYSPDDMTFRSDGTFPEEYNFDTTHYAFDRQALANAGLDATQQYLQLPSDITARTYQLADNITSGIASPYLQAKAIEDYLKTHYTYSFNAPSAPAGKEPNDWFLFQSKSGVCTNFNSAFVILARAAGIPARMAGGFHIDSQEAAQTIYADQAHAWAEVKFQQLGWQTFDATGSSAPDNPGVPAAVKLIDTKTEITTINPIVSKGDTFTVAGTVWTKNAAPAEGTLVEILVNTTKDAKGATLVGQGIVSQGHFSIQAAIPGEVAVGKYQVMAHSLESAQYKESWSDPALKVVSATVIKLAISPRIRLGDKAALSGIITGKFGEPISRQLLGITLDGQGESSPLTDNDGRFTWSNTWNEVGKHTIQVHFAGTEYFLETVEDIALQVLPPAVIELKTGDAAVGQTTQISGQLKEQGTGKALPARSLTLTVDNVTQAAPAVTDSQGQFEFKYIFENTGAHQAKVSFAGDAEYYETSAAASIEVKAAAAGFNIWPLITAVLALAAAGAGGWLFYKWQKNRNNPVLTIAGEEDVESAEAEIHQPWQSSTPGLTLFIELPQIKAPLPDVWGVGEELQVGFRLADDSGAGVAGKLEITINDETSTSLTTNADGRAAFTGTFPSKGQYTLTARYGKDMDEKQASAARPIRIVDYREEIVSLFNKMTAEFRAMGIPITEEYTPRKIQYLVLDAKAGIPEKALEDAVACFEETDYSLHRITRQHYETMYLAQKEIRENGRQPTAARQ